MELETVILEDKQEYAILDTISIHNVKYIYLSDMKEVPTIIVRKLSKEEEMIEKLDTEEEYKMALNAFYKNYEDIFS